MSQTPQSQESLAIEEGGDVSIIPCPLCGAYDVIFCQVMARQCLVVDIDPEMVSLGVDAQFTSYSGDEDYYACKKCGEMLSSEEIEAVAASILQEPCENFAIRS
jgi:hypothetical protein